MFCVKSLLTGSTTNVVMESVKIRLKRQLSEATKRCRSRHPERYAERYAKWAAANRERLNLYRRRRYKNKVTFRLANNFRSRIHSVIFGTKSESASGLLGCSWDQFFGHLEIQFKPGMTWENYGQWHVDHKLPCASFDLTDPAQQKACFGYKNLQPLWAEENLRKGDRILSDE